MRKKQKVKKGNFKKEDCPPYPKNLDLVGVLFRGGFKVFSFSYKGGTTYFLQQVVYKGERMKKRK
ncbi:hypothetical protein [Bacillus sp. FSL M8-0168]|uniref:hypothetical protein n=1 Tax=Bacillus sp. FSL M8-0168 TaxID=2921614 RepID=UPI0030FD7F3E